MYIVRVCPIGSSRTVEYAPACDMRSAYQLANRLLRASSDTCGYKRARIETKYGYKVYTLFRRSDERIEGIDGMPIAGRIWARRWTDNKAFELTD